ncbi:MAG: amino acid adenylation domain-containing protein [Lachnospiraceae bacterium]|nr:amino acid adenylation domain-containing protein [Lachnospiraceae bacterium]
MNDNINEYDFYAKEKQRQQKKYWDNVLKKASADKVFVLHDNPDIAAVSETFTYEFQEEACKKLGLIAKGSETGTYFVLLSGLALMMHRFSGKDSVTLGIPGYMTGEKCILPIVSEISDGETVQEHIAKMGATIQASLSNRDYIQSAGQEIVKIPSVVCRLDSDKFSKPDESAFDFYIEVSIKNSAITARVTYNTGLIAQSKARDLIHYIDNTILYMVNNLKAPVLQAEIMSSEDLDEYRKASMGKAIPLGKQTATEFLKEVFESCADKLAVADRNTRITYRELYEKSGKMAASFKTLGVQKGDRVAIMLNRGVEYITAIVATIRTGASYVPLEVGMPLKRVETILENSEAKLIVTDDKTEIEKLDTKAYKAGLNELFNNSCEDFDISCQDLCGDDTAYIIYTSGTTGKPKGVPISHLSLVNLEEGLKDIAGNCSTDRCFGLLSSFCFDASVQGIFYSLFNGLKLYVFSKEERLDKDALLEIVKREHVDIIDGTPLDLRMMSYSKGRDIGGIRLLFIGGESLMRDVTNDFYNHFRGDYSIVNVYGPTECAVDSTYMTVDKIMDGSEVSVPIGRPLANKRVYVLDKDLKPVPRECMGEIYVAGTGIMSGYVGNEELSREVIKEDIFCQGEVMYKTGDLGYLSYDNLLVCAGRIDSQVKIDGYRIEIGEIEENLRKKEDITDCVVALHETDRSKTLRCYYVTNKETDESFEDGLREYLKDLVPQYMIPKQYIRISEIPFTMNGKVDYTALKKIEPIGTGISHSKARDEEEATILNCFKSCIGNNDFGIDDNFFDEGGNSIKALQLISMLNGAGKDVKIIDIFTFQTVRKLYDNLMKSSKRISDAIKAEEALQAEFGEGFSYEKRSKEGKEYLILWCPYKCSKERISEFLRQKADYSILPHYIVSTAEKEKLERLFSDDKTVDFNTAGEILKKLESEYDDFKKSITDASTEDVYKANALQRMLIDFGLDKSGTNIVIERAIDLDRLKRAFTYIVKKHPLLRSEVVKEQDGYGIIQHEVIPSMPIPDADLTDMPIPGKQKLVMNIINKLYYAQSPKVPGVMYRAYIIKINEKECILSLPAHHCIYDGMSADVIKSDLLRLYDDLTDVSVNSYKNYSKKLKKVRSEEALMQIDRQFETKVFDDFFREKNFNFTHHDRIVKNIKLQSGSEEPWKMVLSLMKSVLGNAFKEEKIPFYLLNYGRKYNSFSFFDLVGPCIDLIPCVLNRGDRVDQIDKKIKENIKVAELLDLNFIISSEDRGANMFNKPVIVFNFQGETDKESYKIRTNLNEDDCDDKEVGNFFGLYIEAFYCEDELHVCIESNMEGISLNDFEDSIDTKYEVAT